MAMWVTHGMIRAMCQAHRKEEDEFGGGNIRLSGEKRKGEKKETKEIDKEGGKRKKMRKRKKSTSFFPRSPRF